MPVVSRPPHTHHFATDNTFCYTPPRAPPHRNHTTHSPRSNIENTHTHLRPQVHTVPLHGSRTCAASSALARAPSSVRVASTVTFRRSATCSTSLCTCRHTCPVKSCCRGNGARERETVLWNLARVKEVRLILPTNSSRVVAPAARVHGDGTRTPHGPSHVVTFPYTPFPILAPPPSTPSRFFSHWPLPIRPTVHAHAPPPPPHTL